MSNEVCKFYLRGACRFGHRCWNSHDRPSIRVARDDVNSNADHQETSVQIASGSKFLQNKQTRSDKVNGLQIHQSHDFINTILHSPKNIATLEKEKGVEVEVNLQQTVEKTIFQDYESIKSLIDSHLQCTICYELFVKPMVLNCSHTFCDNCLSIWLMQVNQCPICRTSVSSKLHCLALDTFIENLVEIMPEDVKKKRALAIEQFNNITVEEENDVDDQIVHAELPDSYFHNQVEDIYSDILFRESDMYSMSLYDLIMTTNTQTRISAPAVRNSLDSMFERSDL